MSCAILVFARAPVPGEVKTRLAAMLGAEAAAALHGRMVRAALQNALTVGQCRTELWCAPGASHPFFRACAMDYGIALREQVGNNLGARMAAAAAEVLGRVERALIVGTDCPSLRPADLESAAALLEQGCDAVLGPAEDGGYVLLGLRRTAPALFQDIPWGGSTVLEETRHRLAALGWRWEELAPRWDVDRPEDLARLAACPGWEDLGLSRRTRSCSAPPAGGRTSGSETGRPSS